MIELLNMDCMKYMKDQPDKAFDLAIVDPPYGIGWDKEKLSMSAGIRKDGSMRHDPTWKTGIRKQNYKESEWDKAKPTEEYFQELLRISINQIIWGGNYFTDILPVTGGWIVWVKGVPEGMSLSQAELAWTNALNSIKVVDLLWAGYKKCEKASRIHPTQKPVKLYEWLLNKYAKPGQRILDTHLGSASSAIAAHYFGAEFVGIEIDKEYYEAAKKRFDAVTSQLALF